MSNPAFLTLDALAVLTDGRWLIAPFGPREDGVTAVLDDSRTVTPGALFIAIRGEFSDGHKYVTQAAENGAAAVCVERAPDDEQRSCLEARGIPCLLVDDTLAAFQALARAHRLTFPDLHVIALTGSSGKTSTKEMIASVLEQKWPGQVLKTEGNTNNHFGVPRNLLRLSRAHRAAVIELGTNHPGEIAALAAIVQPDMGVVSNVGSAHMGLLGGREGVAREKASLLSCTSAGGTVVYPADTRHQDVLAQAADGRARVTFGEAAADVKVAYRGRIGTRFGVTLSWPDTDISREFTWPHCGRHQALNAGAAAAVGTALDVPADAIVNGLLQCRLPKMRMELAEHGGAHWLNDAYNANPDSMRAGLECFIELAGPAPAGKRWLILGDMLELGIHAEQEHRDLLNWVCTTLPEAELVAVGELMSDAAAGYELPTFADSATARDYVLQHVKSGDWVLLKGSRGIQLEQVLPAAPG